MKNLQEFQIEGINVPGAHPTGLKKMKNLQEFQIEGINVHGAHPTNTKLPKHYNKYLYWFHKVLLMILRSFL